MSTLPYPNLDREMMARIELLYKARSYGVAADATWTNEALRQAIEQQRAEVLKPWAS